MSNTNWTRCLIFVSLSLMSNNNWTSWLIFVSLSLMSNNNWTYCLFFVSQSLMNNINWTRGLNFVSLSLMSNNNWTYWLIFVSLSLMSARALAQCFSLYGSVSGEEKKIFISRIRKEGSPLWSSGQSSWLQIQRPRFDSAALSHLLRSSGSGTGSTQPREHNGGATWKK
jgi:hypothetical protein